ncbi:MAG: hypothetical protein V1902_00145 [Candidatus Falkowbacteria bacterium]
MGKNEKPQIIIPDPIHEAINRINKAIWAIVSILILGFITMLLMVAGLVLDAWRFKSNSYEGLIETIRTQEEIINNNKIQQAEVKSILENIQKKLPKK